MKKKKRARFRGTCMLELIIGYLSIYISDWPPNSPAGRRSSSLRHHLGPMPSTGMHYHKRSSRQKLPSLLIALSSLQQACMLLAPQPQECNASQLPFIRRYHTASTRTSWCYCKDHIHVAHSLFFAFWKPPSRLSPCKDWTNHACSPAFTALLTLSLTQKRASLPR